MSSMQNAETGQEKLGISELVERIMASGVGALGVFILVDADDAEIRFAVVDDTLPNGGYIKGFPLMTGQTYLIIPIEHPPMNIERGITVPSISGKKEEGQK